MKIAVYAMALNEAAHVDRWAASAVDADYRVVADTGSTDSTVSLLRDAGVTVTSIAVRPWRFDTARNAALALVPADADICIALDLDAFLPSGWRTILEKHWTPQTTRLWHTYHYLNNTGAVMRTWLHGKVHTRCNYRWYRAVHEDLVHVRDAGVDHTCNQFIINEIQDSAKDRTSYRLLLQVAVEEDPSDSQAWYWLAREHESAGDAENAGQAYRRYLELPSGQPLLRSESMLRLAWLEPADYRAWLFKAMLETQSRPDLWLGMAERFHQAGDWADLLWACTWGLEQIREGAGSGLPEASPAARLYDLGAIAALRQGLGTRALALGLEAVRLSPSDPRLLSNIHYYEAAARTERGTTA